MPSFVYVLGLFFFFFALVCHDYERLCVTEFAERGRSLISGSVWPTRAEYAKAKLTDHTGEIISR